MLVPREKWFGTVFIVFRPPELPELRDVVWCGVSVRGEGEVANSQPLSPGRRLSAALPLALALALVAGREPHRGCGLAGSPQRRRG